MYKMYTKIKKIMYKLYVKSRKMGQFSNPPPFFHACVLSFERGAPVEDTAGLLCFQPFIGRKRGDNTI